jgi:triacylglycerol lipase
MSVWHPLWLPKLVIDAAEEQEAYAVQKDMATPQEYPGTPDGTVSYPDMDLGRGRDPERGNDGLVTVSSAKWGEFLGTMEGCDHWEMRGARGLGADWDEGWGNTWREWVGSWRAGEDRSGGDHDRNERDGVGSLLRKVGGRIPRYSGRAAEEEDKSKDWATRNDLASKFDLERFYVALSRKLYDEGL